ncbi:hypothetical protein KR059_007386 [Drosophila kikkawai]|nr:hypothetical protein KR059_007386 [Drosophila kikkawai]
MTEPSEAWLDWHFKTQLLTYKEEDFSAACNSDRVIMTKWLQVLKAAPASQKMARNSLMLLMHGHIGDFGFLRAPFTDVNNCYRDLNQVINGYHGISLLKPVNNGRFMGNNQEKKGPQRIAGGRSTPRSRPLRRIPKRLKLDPITEVTEPSSAFASGVNLLESDSPRMSLAPASTNVRQKIQAIEKELSMNKPPPMQGCFMRSCRNDSKLFSSIGDANRLSQDPHLHRRQERLDTPSKLTAPLPDQCTHQSHCNNIEEPAPNQDPHFQQWKPPCGCSSAVQNIKNCFQEVSELLKSPAKNDTPVLESIRATAPPLESPKKAFQRIKPFVSKNRLEGRRSIPNSYRRDRTIMDLLRHQEELRLQCLEYYNLDGTLKDDKELPVPTFLPDSKIDGFSIGATKALERIKCWRGKPNQLKFFRTIFRGCGLKSDVTGRVKSLDRRLERVALQWLHSTRRRSKVHQNPPESLMELLEYQKAIKKEYMAHVAEIRKLCEIQCRGVIPSDILKKMFRCLDKEYETAHRAVERLDHQLEDMLSSPC